jgi:hypothetical protein
MNQLGDIVISANFLLVGRFTVIFIHSGARGQSD